MYKDEFLVLIKSVKQKRPKTVIDHIIKHGYITTEDLKELYGYNHPPRAVRDVREYGIPIETFKVTGSDGRKIAAYRFGDYIQANISSKTSGRTNLSKKIKEKLIQKDGPKCFIYNEIIDEKDLQIDHRVPYEVAGDNIKEEAEDYMLLCNSANRAKSWYCEHCKNWNEDKSVDVCKTCYWAYPEKYQHIGMKQVRRVDLLWQNGEIGQYNKLKQYSQEEGKEIQTIIKEIINNRLMKNKQ